MRQMSENRGRISATLQPRRNQKTGSFEHGQMSSGLSKQEAA